MNAQNNSCWNTKSSVAASKAASATAARPRSRNVNIGHIFPRRCHEVPQGIQCSLRQQRAHSDPIALLNLVTANSRIFSKGWFVLSPALSASASPSASNPEWQDRRCQPANLPLTGGRVKQLCLGSLSMAGFAVTTEVLPMNQLPNWETLFGYQLPNREALFGH